MNNDMNLRSSKVHSYYHEHMYDGYMTESALVKLWPNEGRFFTKSRMPERDFGRTYHVGALFLEATV